MSNKIGQESRDQFFCKLGPNRRKEGCLIIAGLKVFVEILAPRRNATWIKSYEQWKL
jgi:hypothetical protein